ncbi:MAG: GPW/gp25 family protein [Chitinophagaceae bacterium]
MENTYNDFMGTGWKFPIEFKKETVVMLTGEEDIKNSLDVLFSTNVGERVMHPNFGSALSTFIFTPINRSAITYMEAIIADEILFNEPRIVLNDVSIQPSVIDNGRLDIEIHYTVTATNNRYNYVYPFYIKEATNLAL